MNLSLPLDINLILSNPEKVDLDMFESTKAAMQSFSKSIESTTANGSTPAHIGDYFNLFNVLSDTFSFNTSNMMWAEMMFLQQKELENINFLKKKSGKKESSFCSTYASLDGWETLNKSLEDASAEQNKVTPPLGALDMLFFEEPETVSISDVAQDYYIVESEQGAFVRFKLGACKEYSYFNNNSMFSHLSLDNGYERFSVISPFEEGFLFFILSSNGNKLEAHGYLLNNQLEFIDKRNVFLFTKTNNNGAFLRISEIPNDVVDSFNSFVFDVEKEKVIVKSVTYPLVETTGFNLFIEAGFKGFDFPLVEDDELALYNKAHIEKKEELVDFTLIKSHCHKDFGRRANFLTKHIFQSSMFLLRDFTSLDVKRILFGVPTVIRFPMIDFLKPNDVVSADKMFSGNSQKYEALDALNTYKIKIDVDFGKAIFGDKSLYKTVLFQEIVDDFCTYKTNQVDEESLDSLVKKPRNILDGNGILFGLEDFKIISITGAIKSTFGFLSLSYKEDIDFSYRNINIPEEIKNQLKLSEVGKSCFLFDKRIFSEREIKERLLSYGCQETSFTKPNKAVKPKDILLKIETEEDPSFIQYTVKFSDSEYYNQYKDFEDFENTLVEPVFFSGLNKESFLHIENVGVNEYKFVIKNEESVKTYFENYLSNFSKL